MIGFPPELWTTANQSTSGDATVESLRASVEKMVSMGPVLVRFRANRGGFAYLRRFSQRITGGTFQGVPIDESDDYDNPSKPARIVAVMRDPRTGMESEKLVYATAEVVTE